jgi:hypothetical protein
MRRKNGTDPTGGDDEILIASDSFSIGDTLIHEGSTYRRAEVKDVLRERPEAFLPWADSTTGERRRRNTELMERAGFYG